MLKMAKRVNNNEEENIAVADAIHIVCGNCFFHTALAVFQIIGAATAIEALVNGARSLNF